jgi:hypothetical protein
VDQENTMSDPAIEAAQRAWEEYEAQGGVWKPEALRLAAREALKPIRATYARWESAFGGCRGEVPEMVQVLLDELAPLIYTTEELEQ